MAVRLPTSTSAVLEDSKNMQHILRFLQLLCENHNHDLQVTDKSMVTIVFEFKLSCLCR